MRCRIGAKKLMRYSKKYGIDFVGGTTRGNTGHRVELWDKDGVMYNVWPNGSIERYKPKEYAIEYVEGGFIAHEVL